MRRNINSAIQVLDMYSKIIAIGKLQESAIMYVGDVKDVIVFRLCPDIAQPSEDGIELMLPIECKYEVFRGDDYLLALKPGTTVFVEGDLSISKNPDTILSCIVKKIFMIAEQEINYQS
jgi:hypothetical protein